MAGDRGGCNYVRRAVVRGEDRWVVHYGYEKWAGTKKRLKLSRVMGLLVASEAGLRDFKELGQASPPSLVPNSEDKERSGATGARWVALVRAYVG